MIQITKSPENVLQSNIWEVTPLKKIVFFSFVTLIWFHRLWGNTYLCNNFTRSVTSLIPWHYVFKYRHW